MNRRIISGAVASAVYIATSVLASFLQVRLIVKALPADIAGLWFLFLTAGAVVTLLDLGMGPTLAREISFNLGAPNLIKEERARRIGELLATFSRAFLFAAIGVGLLGLVLGEILIFFASPFRANPQVTWGWAIFSLGLSANLLGSVALNGLFGMGNVASEKLIRCCSLLIGLSLIIGVLTLRWGIAGLGAAWTLQAMAGGLFGWIRLRRVFPEVQQGRHAPNWNLARRLVSPSLKLASIQIGAILILQSANPVIASVIGTGAIPPYEAISKMATTMMSLALLIVNSSTPFFSMDYAAGELGKLQMLLFHNLRAGVGLIVVLAGFVAVNGDTMIALWLGRSVFAGNAVLWALLAMVLLEVHHSIFAAAVMAAGHIVFGTAALASGVLTVLLAVSLAARWGLPGVAFAVMMAQLLTNNWYAPYVAVRFFRIPVRTLVRQVWAPMGLLLAGQVTVNVLIRRVPALGASNLLALVTNLALSATAGAAMWWMLALTSEERRNIVEGVKSLLHGRGSNPNHTVI